MSGNNMKHIAALDVGTTTVRLHILDEHARTVASSSDKIELLYPKPGQVEIDPHHLWHLILKVIKAAINDCESSVVRSIVGLGISTQRSTFTTWNRESGRHYHNFITWKDLRADGLVKEWNGSMTLKGLRVGAQLLFALTRNKRFKALGVFKLMNTQITPRLCWALSNIPGLRKDAQMGEALFGGVDSWLLYKLTGRHMTDVSSASTTGLFDPFTMRWSTAACNLFQIPASLLPEIVDTAAHLGNTPKDLFGIQLAILCSMADQAASLYGSGCFGEGELKVTMGTGTFINVNTASEPHASVAGLYPLVGWRVASETTYIAEGASNDTGSVIEWAISAGFVDQASRMSQVARSVQDSDGVFFVPAFSGLQAPINDQSAATGFLGIKPTTTKAHLVRAILESLVFRVGLLYETLCQETRHSYRSIRVDGGVSQNDFMMQLLADLSGLRIERASSSEMSILGVAFLAGLESGVWKDREQLLKMRAVGHVFLPRPKMKRKYDSTIAQWRKAVERFGKWY